MGQIVKLIELVERINQLDGEDIIFACEPWTADSDAMSAREQEGQPFGVPVEAAEAGMTYFLEVDIARDEVLEGWIASLNQKPTLAETCERLIYYAVNDA